ncbi:AAA family ATPase [Archangium gephyra]|uniref:AAA family ATPase n=1 Tax=Archangium gephyra TaxID=48 RepID=UPI003B772D6C
MKLLVRKLGLIDHAELDIRPLTVLIGENGTNKTWVAYSLYGLMRSMVRSGASPLPVEHALDDVERSTREQIQADNAAIASTLAQEGSQSLSLERDFSKYFAGGSATHALVGKALFFRDLLRLPEGLPADVESRLELGGAEFRVETEPARIEVTAAGGGVMLRVRISSENDHRFYFDSKERLRDASWWEEALSFAFTSWFSQSAGKVFVLPAERKTLASAHDLLRDEFGKVVTIPVADYAEFLGSRRRLAERGFEPEGESPLRDLAGLLERKVVKGAIGFKGGDVEGAHLSFSPSAQVELPIHAASSLVRALAGLDLYLQTAMPGDFVVIDELEMNAHPEAQLALTELVAMLVNRGLRVVMTTHSPYIVDHLNNLMAAARVPPERQDELAPHFRLGSREAFLPADKVAAYHFAPVDGKVEVRDVLDRETEAIDWRTFSRVTDELSNLYGRILEAKERE